MEGQAAPAATNATPPPAIPPGRDLRGVPEPVQRIEAILNAERAEQEPAAPAAAPAEQVTEPQEATHD